MKPAGPPADKPANAPGGTDTTNKPSTEKNPEDQVHVSFDGSKIYYL